MAWIKGSSRTLPPPASPPTRRRAGRDRRRTRPPPPPLLTREGFEARVKGLFEEKQNGAEAAAAAAAYQKAQREHSRRAKGARGEARRAEPSSAAPPPGGQTSPRPPAVGATRASRCPSTGGRRSSRWRPRASRRSWRHKSDGIVFVDPSFPLSDPRVFTRRHSLYASELTATTWKCRACTAPPLPPPTTHEQLAALYDPRTQAQTITCTHCGMIVDGRGGDAADGLGAAVARPRRRDASVRLCAVGGVPWRPRPDDVRQGGVGNCWLVCAMSCPQRRRRGCGVAW